MEHFSDRYAIAEFYNYLPLHFALLALVARRILQLQTAVMQHIGPANDAFIMLNRPGSRYACNAGIPIRARDPALCEIPVIVTSAHAPTVTALKETTAI